MLRLAASFGCLHPIKLCDGISKATGCLAPSPGPTFGIAATVNAARSPGYLPAGAASFPMQLPEGAQGRHAPWLHAPFAVPI